ncbi:MAG: sigma-70 family RNA polymerase sigma factor [Verrucomicrobia bacterium]|nr:sigma-70 family RNA polymerase sigma factor [Cytophagales bacterium]
MLYDNYSGALYGIILKIVRTEEIAADVMQEAFVKMWKNIDSYERNKGTLFTWMLNIARNLAIDKTRSSSFKQQSQNRNLEDNVSMLEKSVGSQQNNETQTDMIGMEKVIQQLKPEWQELIQMIYFQGFTQSEVAETLNIPLGTVKTRIKAAISALRLLVKD